jgi:hypothetical protein
MKLYDVPRNTKIRIPEWGDEILEFKHVDGMYSLSFDAEDKPVHLVAWTEVEIVDENNHTPGT